MGRKLAGTSWVYTTPNFKKDPLLLALALSPLILWIIFAAVMALVSARNRYPGTLPIPIRVLGYPLLALGLVVDLGVNVLICPVLFLELPREWTVSSRLWRLSNSSPSWRQRTALWLRVNLLDPIDPSGVHRG